MGEPADIHELAAGYVLHALDHDELASFEAHLGRCTVCKEELGSLRAAAASLAYGADGPAPTAGLRTEILDRVRRDAPGIVVPLRRGWTLPAATSLAAAAACAAIGLGIWTASLSSSLEGERSARRAEAQALAIVASPNTSRSTLRGANGSLIVTPERDAALVVNGLASAPAGKSYEVWVVERGTPRPAGVFRGGEDPSLVVLTRRVPAGARVAVSVERAGGVDRLSGPMLFDTQTS